VPWYQDLSLLRCSKPFLDSWIVPVSSCVENLKVDHLASCFHGEIFCVTSVRNFGGISRFSELKYRWMNLQEDRIGDSAILAGAILHRMVPAEAEMNVFIHPSHLVGIQAPLITARGWDDDQSLA
jgi:hypothetical protein